MIFYLVVGAALQEGGDPGPFIPVKVVGLQQYAVLLLGPLILFDIRVQVVVPPLSALLAHPPREVG